MSTPVKRVRRRNRTQKSGKAAEVDLKRIRVEVPNPKFSGNPAGRQTKKRGKKSMASKIEGLEEKVISASLQQQGVDSSTAKALARGVYYEGIPMSVITIPGIVQDLVYNAQICALHMIARYPQLIFDPTNQQTRTIAPTEIVAYLVTAGLCHARKLGLLEGYGAEKFAQAVNLEYRIPVGFAKYLEYAFVFEGPPKMQTLLTLTADFTLPLQNVSVPTGSLNYDLSQLQIFNNVENHNAVMFPIKLGARDSTIFTGPYSVPYSGLAEGASPFLGSQFSDKFSVVLQGIDVIETVPFGKIGHVAPDASAFVAPYGPESNSSNWTQYTGVMCANSEFDVDMAMICRPNFNFSTVPVTPFPLGHQDTVPQPSAPAYASNSIPLSTQGTNITQQFDWFYWNGMRNEYNVGKWRDAKSGWRLRSGHKIGRYFKVVNRQIDTFGLTRQALIGLVQYSNTALIGSLLTDDYFDMFVQWFETLLLTKIFSTGNWNLQGALGANATLSIQQLLPFMGAANSGVPLWVKALIDEVGSSVVDGTIVLPQLTINAGSTLASPSTVNWQNWPKFGSVLQTGGPANNRYSGAAQGSVSFPFVSSNCPVAADTGIQGVPSSAQIPSGGGSFTTQFNLTTGQSVFSAGIIETALNALTAAQALPTVGSYNANFVMWQNLMPGIVEYVCSLFGSQSVDRRGLLASLNSDNSYGGPAMLTIQLAAQRQDTDIQKFSATKYSVTQNAIVPPTNSSIFAPYVPVKYDYFAPLSPVDHGLALSFPVSSIYKENQAFYTMATAFTEIPISSLGNAAQDAATAKLTEVGGEVSKSYENESSKNHYGGVGILRNMHYRAGRDCLRKALLSLGERASEQFAQTDWLKVTKKMCRWGVSTAGIGWAQPACSLVPKIVRVYKSVRTNYDTNKEAGKVRGDTSPIVMAASH
jgi:hypothetical protein